MRTYGQYCPIARTSELFAERWTPIIIRNLLAGCRTFGDLLEGAPGISKALLVESFSLPPGRYGHEVVVAFDSVLSANFDADDIWRLGVSP
jgi:hypothetical protein